MPTKSKNRKPETPEEAKVRRARARRALRRANRQVEKIHGGAKPVEEWDIEELARGRPRAPDGTFKGVLPTTISRAVFEVAISRFKDMSQADMRAMVPAALDAVKDLIEDRRVDEKGRLVIPPSVRLAASQWVLEHLVGKPTQRIEGDISVKLQGILANVMVSPDKAKDGTIPAIDVESWGDDPEDEDNEALG